MTKVVKKVFVTAAAVLLCVLAVSCGIGGRSSKPEEETEEAETEEYIVIGFSQLGAESDWRSANTESIQATFTKENGYELLLEDGQQKQANQIMAIRTFIQQEVDYIVLAPVIETGWDTVLQEAKEAGIPVILVDRMVDVSDESLYAAWVGSDFYLEGARMGEWICRFLEKQGIEKANIVNIQGTIGASAQIGRTKGLKEACAGNTVLTLLEEVTGDFTQAKGKEVMESLLKKYQDINIVYCENDNEAFGVIEAIEAAGKTAGSDISSGEIMVVSFDGVNKEAMEYVLSGKISCIAECNPLLGPRVQAIIAAFEEGKIPDKCAYVEEEMYAHDNTVVSVTVAGTEYPVTVVTQEMLEQRAY